MSKTDFSKFRHYYAYFMLIELYIWIWTGRFVNSNNIFHSLSSIIIILICATHYCHTSEELMQKYEEDKDFVGSGLPLLYWWQEFFLRTELEIIVLIFICGYSLLYLYTFIDLLQICISLSSVYFNIKHKLILQI